jgi:hypothetical protein
MHKRSNTSQHCNKHLALKQWVKQNGLLKVMMLLTVGILLLLSTSCQDTQRKQHSCGYLLPHIDSLIAHYAKGADGDIALFINVKEDRTPKYSLTLASYRGDSKESVSIFEPVCLHKSNKTIHIFSGLSLLQDCSYELTRTDSITKTNGEFGIMPTYAKRVNFENSITYEIVGDSIVGYGQNNLPFIEAQVESSKVKFVAPSN